MIKKHRKFKQPTMRRSSRVFLDGWVNSGKLAQLSTFLCFYHDLTQFFVDLFWSQRDFSARLADLPDIHKGRDRFHTTTRLSQAAAKQAKQAVRAAGEGGTKPELRRHVADLCYHFVTIEEFEGSFDLAVCLGGAGVPKLLLPCKSTVHLNQKLQSGWQLGSSIRLGKKNGRIYIDFILEKPRPPRRTRGRVLGLDSNYKNGLVTSAGQMAGQENYHRIQSFDKRQKHRYKEAKDLLGQAVRSLDLADCRTLVVEDLKHVRKGTRGKFSRASNRRLSHWLYAYALDLISRRCEEEGIELLKKLPAYTSQFCRACGRWDRRNRRGDRFLCVNCGSEEHADINAAKNMELLGLAGSYGIRLLKKSNCHTFR